MPAAGPETAIISLPPESPVAPLSHPKEHAVAARRLGRPEGATPQRVRWGYAAAIVAIHLYSLLVFVPWLFSWTGVFLFIAGHYIFGMLGITLGYHRLLTHQGFVCPRWLERTFVLLGVCCLQDTPARWVAVHRRHHQHSDDQPDPHSPLVNLFWGHFGWLMVQNRELDTLSFYDRYARDVLRDDLYRWLERRLMWLWVYGSHALLFLLAGFAIGWATSGELMGGVQFGASLLVWGVFARTVLVWHVTWSVNSLTHVWGYRNYETSDNSRNNWLVGLLAHGEGWHNNHHAEQRTASHGHRWWEVDFTWATIRMLELVGLAHNVVRPQTWTEKQSI